jgi:phosphoribosylaminoimidazole-succinocarboxamide synthase
MSKQAVEFLEDWIDRHVTPAEKDADSTRATTLAGMCREAAASLGISFDDIKPEFGTVETIIHEAIRYVAGTPEE